MSDSPQSIPSEVEAPVPRDGSGSYFAGPPETTGVGSERFIGAGHDDPSAHRPGRWAFVVLFILLVTLVSGRGLLRSTPLAGHDTAAAYASQQEFFSSLAEGNLFPRWAGNMRFGYGHPQFTFRPPVPHFVASLIQRFTDDPFRSLNLALVVCLFISAAGAFCWLRSELGLHAGLVAAACFAGSNYLLADIYLRGAFYETFSAAWMPWILWTQAGHFRRPWSRFAAGALAWSALISSHPAMFFLFMPVAFLHAAFHSYLRGDRGVATRSLLSLVLGLMISAPYWFVAMQEQKLVRFDLFYYSESTWRHRFLTLKELFFESWPDRYREFVDDSPGAPLIHLEMRGLSLLFIAALVLTPFWFLYRMFQKRRGKGGLSIDRGSWIPDEAAGCALEAGTPAKAALFYYLCALSTLCLAFPVSYSIWSRIHLMETFNFPWRVLLIVSLCLAATLAAIADEGVEKCGKAGKIGAAVIVLWALAAAGSHSRGWNGPNWLSKELMTPEVMRRNSGVPQQFYTPGWVRNYPDSPAAREITVLTGDADATLEARRTADWKIALSCRTPATIQLSHFYYPGWRVVDENGLNIPVHPGENGLITFGIPEGNHSLTLEFGSTATRSAAFGASLLGVIFLIASISLLPGPDQPQTAPPAPGPGVARALAAALALLLTFCAAESSAVFRRDELERTGLEQLASGLNREAIYTFARQVRECPTDLGSSFNLGAALHNHGWFDEALFRYDLTLSQALAVAVRTAHSAARIHAARGNIPTALLYYEEALRILPGDEGILKEYEALKSKK